MSMATVAGISTTVLGVDLTNYSYHCGVAALRWDHNLEEVISNNVRRFEMGLLCGT